ncbi:hypothetical protein [Kitasatospora sp. NPDC001175]|uniref:hypothetical protein n=1 Tax=Kitasatospora sp. NPDC001175 TaxID=3157103 RepID=UPI003D039E2C
MGPHAAPAQSAVHARPAPPEMELRPTASRLAALRRAREKKTAMAPAVPALV